MTLSDLGTIVATISGLVALWLNRERLKSQKEKTRIGLAILGCVALLIAWRAGWLDGLQIQITVPAWILFLCPFISIGAAAGIVALIVYIKDKLFPSHYEIYGARWELSGGLPDRPPICTQCLMIMQYEKAPSRSDPHEVWRCRQCRRIIDWDASVSGDLLADVRAHYDAELRLKLNEK